MHGDLTAPESEAVSKGASDPGSDPAEKHALGDHLRPAAVSLLLFTVLCGIAYPMALTAIAEIVWPRQARGSVLESQGKAVGSELIGQPFDDPAFLWGRPSATVPIAYTAFSAATLTGSSGSNLGPTNPALVDAVRDRIGRLVAWPHDAGPIPADLVTASASGLDPHISPDAARWQAPRIAAARRIPLEAVIAAIDEATEGRTFGVLGEPRVNVLLANRALERNAAPGSRPAALRSAP